MKLGLCCGLFYALLAASFLLLTEEAVQEIKSFVFINQL